MQDERAVDELPALRTAEVERLCRRVVTAERRAAAVAVQRDALREQFLLVQQQCSELLAENAQVHGVNAALNGMLGILRDAASVPSSAAEAEVLLMDAGREAEGESGIDDGLSDILAEIYGPQYLYMRRAESVDTEGGDEIVE